MGMIICQYCNSTIVYFKDKKVTKLYSSCCSCEKQSKKKNK